jgi:hypothetical protein
MLQNRLGTHRLSRVSVLVSVRFEIACVFLYLAALVLMAKPFVFARRRNMMLLGAWLEDEIKSSSSGN